MSILLIACGALARELIAIREHHQLDDVTIMAIPAQLHNHPHKIPNAVHERLVGLRQDGLEFEHAIIVYGDCGTGGMLDRKLAELGLERIEGPHCYEQYAGAEGFERMMDETPGTFFLTDFMVQSYEHLIIEGLGLDRYPELRDMYFGNYERIVYLQQRSDPDLVTRAYQVAGELQLPLEIKFTAYGELETRLLRKIHTLKAGNFHS
ncbi:MAG: DUF1638 domain-containing protein [Phototrophicaceae bacterium]